MQLTITKMKAFYCSNNVLLLVLGAFISILPSISMPELIQPTQTGKFIFFGYMMVVIFGLWVIKEILKPGQNIQINWLDLVLGFLFVYVLINRYWIQSLHGFSMKYYELLGLSALYLVLRSLSAKAYLFVLLALSIGGMIQAIYGAFQLWGYYPSHHSGFRMTGSFFNPGPFAGFLAVVFPISLGMYVFRRKFENVLLEIKTPHFSFSFFSIRLESITIAKKTLKLLFEYIPLLAMFSILLVLPASQSRAAWLAVLLSGGMLLFIRYNLPYAIVKLLNRSWKKTTALGLGIVFVIMGSYGLYHFKKDSADGRLLIWKVTCEMIADYPVFGIGYDRFQAHYMNYQADYFQTHGENGEEMVAGEAGYAFNELLLFITEQGFLGLSLLIIAGLVLVITIFKRTYMSNPMMFIATSGLLAFSVFGFFGYPGEILPTKLIAVITLAGLAKFAPIVYLERRNPKLSKVALAACLVLTTTFIPTKVNKLKKGFTGWQEAYQTYKFGLYEDSVIKYEKLDTSFYNNGDFLMNYGKALVMAEQYKDGIEVLKRAGRYLSSTITSNALGDGFKAIQDYSSAEAAYWNAWYMIPSRFYPKYLLAKLYNSSDQRGRATTIAKELLEKDVKIPSMAIKEIRAEMKNIIDASKEQ